MNSTSLTAREEHLVAEAKALLRERRRPGLNTVVAAVLTESGSTYFGLNLESRKSAVCAEPAALAAAHWAGDYGIETVVAVCLTPDHLEATVISPCGACRELLWFHAPDARVAVRRDGAHHAVTASELFSDAEMFPEATSSERPIAAATTGEPPDEQPTAPADSRPRPGKPIQRHMPGNQPRRRAR